jgi:hypothetical protein
MCSLTGIIKYVVKYKNKLMDLSSTPHCTVTVFAQNGTRVTSVKGLTGKIHIPKADFWWPYLTNPTPGYLYKLKVSLGDEQFSNCVLHEVHQSFMKNCHKVHIIPSFDTSVQFFCVFPEWNKNFS